MAGDPAADEATVLAAALEVPAPRVAPRDDLSRWAGSGAMALTGAADGPPLAPGPPVASRLAAAAAVLAALSERVGSRVDVDGPALLGERAALRGLTRRGTVSAGGSCRMVRCTDGWVAVSLTRDDDWATVPAWLQRPADDWDDVAASVATRSGAEVADRAGLLGLAVAAVGPTGTPAPALPWRLTVTPGRRPLDRRRPLRVVDLSALWAGPLCAHLLARAGAEVVTVEDPQRHDGARVGDPHLHELLHAGHSVVPLPLSTDAGRRRLQELVLSADVVITAARARALDQLGLDPDVLLRYRPGLTCVVITGYGLRGADAARVGYGDDTAAAGGLVVPGDPPMFCADAVADPATGLYAALAALSLVAHGGGVADVAMRDVAAHLARAPRGSVRPATRDRHGAWCIDAYEGPVAVAPPRVRTRV